MKKNILLCGDVGVGKSTLIRRLLEETQLTVGGFCTKMDKDSEEEMHPIYIYPAAVPVELRQRNRGNLVGRCGDFGRKKEIFAEVFDAVGTAYLQDTQGCQVMVMDEMGFMESEAHQFRNAVLRALDGDLPVLAAVKNRRDVDFLRQVLTHPKGAVYRITPENREELFRELLPIVREWKR